MQTENKTMDRITTTETDAIMEDPMTAIEIGMSTMIKIEVKATMTQAEKTIIKKERTTIRKKTTTTQTVAILSN